MRRGAAVLLIACLAATLVAAAGDARGPRRHRIRLPEAPLGRTLTVDETEWAIRGSKAVVAAGLVTLRAYNRGMDDHNVFVVDGSGTPHVVDLKPGATGTIEARFSPGQYRIICSLFAGTTESHEAKGMAFTLTVR